MEKTTQPKAISGILGKILKSFGLTTNYYGWMVVEKWDDIVGKEIAQRAHAVRYEDQTLFVEVADDSWRQEISMKIDEILAAIHKQTYGRAVKQIRLIKMRKDI